MLVSGAQDVNERNGMSTSGSGYRREERDVRRAERDVDERNGMSTSGAWDVRRAERDGQSEQDVRRAERGVRRAEQDVRQAERDVDNRNDTTTIRAPLVFLFFAATTCPSSKQSVMRGPTAGRSELRWSCSFLILGAKLLCVDVVFVLVCESINFVAGEI